MVLSDIYDRKGGGVLNVTALLRFRGADKDCGCFKQSYIVIVDFL